MFNIKISIIRDLKIFLQYFGAVGDKYFDPSKEFDCQKCKRKLSQHFDAR